MQTKFRKLGTAALLALVASLLIRVGQSHLEGLRGEPSGYGVAHSAENLKQIAKLVAATHPRIALPKNDLGSLGEKTLNSLPTQADFRNLTAEEAHTMPRALFEGALKLKIFADRLDQALKSAENDPKTEQAIASEGALFYQNCSDQDQTPSALRAVCYLHFIELSVKSGHPENIPHHLMPPDVIQIARAISPHPQT